MNGVGAEAMCHKVCHGRDKLSGAFAVCWDGDLRFVGIELAWKFEVCRDGDLRFVGMEFTFRWVSGGLVFGGICEYISQQIEM